jgi:hypothetical protein
MILLSWFNCVWISALYMSLVPLKSLFETHGMKGDITEPSNNRSAYQAFLDLHSTLGTLNSR